MCLDIATSQLKDILIELQTHLLHHLRHAQEDENFTDFRILIDASDLGRVKTVKTLCDLYMRMATAADIQRFGSSGPTSPEFIDRARTMVQRTIEDREANGGQRPRVTPVLVDEQPRPVDVQQNATFRSSISPQGSSTQTPFSLANGNPPKRTTMFGRITFRSSRRSHIETRTTGFLPNMDAQSSSSSASHDSNSKTSIEPLHSGPASFDSGVSMTVTNPLPFTREPYFIEDEDNPWAAETTSSSATERGGLHQLQSGSTTSTPAVSLGPPTRLNLPCAANKFAGFCKGAFNLQVGSQTLNLAREIGPVMTTHFFYACRKCSFGGPAYSRPSGWEYDTSIHKSHGVQYRWIFLAKSHVKQGRVKNGIHSYKCIFCVLLNVESPVFQKAGTLVEHIATHRGRPLGEAILERTSCIDGRVAEESEQFDINLTPLDQEMQPLNALGSRQVPFLSEIPLSTHTAFGLKDFG